jgi:hypothetical protein
LFKTVVSRLSRSLRSANVDGKKKGGEEAKKKKRTG